MIQAASVLNPPQRSLGHPRSETAHLGLPVRKKAEEKGYFLQVPAVLLEAYQPRFTPLAHLTLLRFLSHYLTWERDQAVYRGSYRALARELNLSCSTLTAAVKQWEQAGLAQVSDDGLLTITVALDPLWQQNVTYRQQNLPPSRGSGSVKGHPTPTVEVSKNQTAELSSNGSGVQKVNTAVQNLNTAVQNLDEIVQNLNTFERERVLRRIKNLQESLQNLFFRLEEVATSPEESVVEPAEKKACFSSFSDVSEQGTEMRESSVGEGFPEAHQVPASKGSAEEGSDLPDHGNIPALPLSDPASPSVLPDQEKRTERQIPPAPGGRSVPKKSPPVPTSAGPGSAKQADPTSQPARSPAKAAHTQREADLWALFDRLFGCRVSRSGYNTRHVRDLADNPLASDAVIEETFALVVRQAEERANLSLLTITTIADRLPAVIRQRIGVTTTGSGVGPRSTPKSGSGSGLIDFSKFTDHEYNHWLRTRELPARLRRA